MVRQQVEAARPPSFLHRFGDLRYRLLKPAAIASVALAAVVLVGLLGAGLLYYFYPTNNSVNPSPVVQPSPREWNDSDLRARLLEHTLSLANAKAPVEQLDALTDMADDLEYESLAQAGQVDNAQLTRLAALYERVTEDGVVPHALALPPENRQEKLRLLADAFRQAATDTKRVAEQKPAASEPLMRFSLAAAKVSDLLKNPQAKLPAPKPQTPEASEPLVDALVLHGLVLADQNDPLKRAEICTDVADSLLRTILEASQRGSDNDEMQKLGTGLGAVMNRAINGNLERVDRNAADKMRQAKYDEVKERAKTTIAKLQHYMENAPPHSREGLQQAFQSARFGHFNNIGPPRFFGKDLPGKDRHKGKH